MGLSSDEALEILGLTELCQDGGELNVKIVKRQYKKLALKWHPDKSSDAEAKGKFQLISDAYSRITDPERENEGEDDDDEEDDCCPQ
ncbi:unnamed protein product [Phaeothamnion confervicola]